MTTENKIAVLAAITAILSMLFSIYYSTQASRSALISNNIQKTEILLAYTNELRGWSERVLDTLSEASHVEPSDERKRTSLLIKLSAEIDMGRQFFPNKESDSFGEWKQSAYRGFRPEILDHLVKVYDIIDNNFIAEQEDIWGLRKSFVSDVQRELNPQNIEQMIKSLNLQST